MEVENWQFVHRLAAWGDLDAFVDFCSSSNNLEAILTNFDRETTLHIAVKKGHLHIVEFLCIDYPMLLNQKTNYNQTVLHYAVTYRQPKILAYLLSICDDELLFVRDDRDRSAFELAAENGNVEIAIMLVDRDYGVVSKHSNISAHALHIAVGRQHEAFVKYVLTVCPSTTKMTFWGDNALHFAVRHKSSTNISKCLLQADPELLTTPNLLHETAFIHAINDNINLQANMLLADYPQVLEYGSDARKALFQTSCPRIAARILELKPEIIDDFSDDGNTVLHMTVNAEVAKLVLRLKPEFAMQQNERGFIPLQAAKSKAVADVLLLQTPDWDGTDRDGNTALHIAVHGDQYHVISHVFEHQKESVNRCNAKGNTPAHCAAMNRNFFAVSLFQHSISIETALDLWEKSRVVSFDLDLLKTARRHLLCLHMYLLPDIQKIIHDFLGLPNICKRKWTP